MPNQTFGYVYLLGSSTFGWYKIGKSRTPEIRVMDIGVLLPFKIEVFAIWKAVDHDALETVLHKKYAHYRINGEWFRFNPRKIQSLLFDRSLAPARISGKFSNFSNIESDYKKPYLTTEERELRKNQAIAFRKAKPKCPFCGHSISQNNPDTLRKLGIKFKKGS